MISPFLTDERSMFDSLSGVSHGRAAIHRSSQLQPQCGFVGSMKSKFGDLADFFHVCCVVQMFSNQINVKKNKSDSDADQSRNNSVFLTNEGECDLVNT